MKSKNKKQEAPNNYDKFSAASSTECTGLITVPPETDYELENYADIIDFGPICSKDDNKKENVKKARNAKKQ